MRIQTERLDRLDQRLNEGRICRNAWENANGSAICLLGALFPETAVARSPSACPTDEMPRWLAELTPWMADNVSSSAWRAFGIEYARVLRSVVFISLREEASLHFSVRLELLSYFSDFDGTAAVRTLCKKSEDDGIVGEPNVTRLAWQAVRLVAAQAAEKREQEAWKALPKHVSFTSKAAAEISDHAAALRAAEAAAWPYEGGEKSLVGIARWISEERRDDAIMSTLKVIGVGARFA